MNTKYKVFALIAMAISGTAYADYEKGWNDGIIECQNDSTSWRYN